MLRENNSLASLCWLQGNLVRKKARKKNNKTAASIAKEEGIGN